MNHIESHRLSLARPLQQSELDSTPNVNQAW
uniref:Uncharacterized protein n=1 Tax=Rhizophora mucronata TaxID=61149 RepID=A0A2P2PQL3_RHIMU